MTARVTRRARPETVDAKYNRLSRRVVRRLPVTAAESRWLWNETLMSEPYRLVDPYRVLPHRDIVCVRPGRLTTEARFEHKPCGMDLGESDVIDANWCPHCVVTINKAADRRAIAARSPEGLHWERLA